MDTSKIHLICVSIGEASCCWLETWMIDQASDSPECLAAKWERGHTGHNDSDNKRKKCELTSGKVLSLQPHRHWILNQSEVMPCAVYGREEIINDWQCVVLQRKKRRLIRYRRVCHEMTQYWRQLMRKDLVSINQGVRDQLSIHSEYWNRSFIDNVSTVKNRQ